MLYSHVIFRLCSVYNWYMWFIAKLQIRACICLQNKNWSKFFVQFLRHCLELHLSPVNKKKLITRSHQILIFMKVTLFFLYQTNFGSQTYVATNLVFLKRTCKEYYAFTLYEGNWICHNCNKIWFLLWLLLVLLSLLQLVANYIVRRLIGPLCANIKLITITKQFN